MTLSSSWARQRHAADCLCVSERTLHRWRASGLLKPGLHFRRTFPTGNSPLLYHLERCEQAMNEACARTPGLLEVAPRQSTQASRRGLESHLPQRSGSASAAALVNASQGASEGKAGEDGQSLADGGIDAAAGPIAEQAGGIKRRAARRLVRG